MTTRLGFALELLPSNVYHMTWRTIEYVDSIPKECELFFASKAAIVKLMNAPKTYPEIKEFISKELKSGTTIK